MIISRMMSRRVTARVPTARRRTRRAATCRRWTEPRPPARAPSLRALRRFEAFVQPADTLPRRRVVGLEQAPHIGDDAAVVVHRGANGVHLGAQHIDAAFEV